MIFVLASFVCAKLGNILQKPLIFIKDLKMINATSQAPLALKRLEVRG